MDVYAGPSMIFTEAALTYVYYCKATTHLVFSDTLRVEEYAFGQDSLDAFRLTCPFQMSEGFLTL